MLIKKILLISLVLNLILVGFLGRRIYWKYFAKNKTTYHLERNQIFKHLHMDTNSIVFLGNSLTEYYELAEFHQNLNLKNRGISGDDIPGVLNRLEEIIQAKPKKIFIEIGINDLGNGDSKEEVLSNYKKLIRKLTLDCPNSQLYIQSILPTAAHFDGNQNYCNPQINEDIRSINQTLKTESQRNNITFIDLYPHFQKENFLNDTYHVDGLHLSGKGYMLWTELIKDYIND
jgi:lysophospholipase L1-like esterase